MKGASFGLALLLSVSAGSQLRQGATFQYRVVVTQTEYAGSGSKITSQNTTETPIVFRASGPGTLEVTSGPLFTRGRSVGRARVSTVTVNGSRVPGWFCLSLPAGGLKPGKKWTATLSAPAPIPAGLLATYTSRLGAGGITPVDVAVNQKSTGSDLRAAGKLLINSKTGFPQGGKVRFDISYFRPDMKDRTKMIVNSHMTVECQIKPK